MDRYYCTSSQMRSVPVPKFFGRNKFFIEYNPNIEMFRVNREEGLPKELMGYSPHKKALISTVAKWMRENARNNT